MTNHKQNSEIRKNRTRRERGSITRKVIRWLFILAVLGLIGVSAAGVGLYLHLSGDLPKITSLADYRPSVITTVYSDDNRKIAEFYKERRIVLPLSKMPKMLIEAFIAAEDARFYKHKGIDFLSIIRAFFKNLEAGTIVQGGSTITQQVTKSFLLTPERSYRRKMKEAILAYRIDNVFTKEEILFLYLNQIYLGHGAYGVQAAAENYFDKAVEDLNLAECAILAGLPQAPSRYSPFRHPNRARERQIYTLNRMVTEGYITRAQAAEAMDIQLDIMPRKNWYIEKVPSYTEHIRRMLEEIYGPEMLYTGGLQVYTAVNVDMQKIAREELKKGLFDLDKRQGYRGPLMHLKPEEIESFSSELQAEFDKAPLAEGQNVKGVVIEVDDPGRAVYVRMGNSRGRIDLETMRWARRPDLEVAYYEQRIDRPSNALKVGNVIEVAVKGQAPESELWTLNLEQQPIAQAAMLAIEEGSGEVKAMVGGLDFQNSQFNRAIQSRRQPGSAFKPIIYAAALDKQFTPASIIIDSPIVFEDTERAFVWKPKNYKEKFYGPTRLREALAKSRNVVTIKLLREIGIDYLIDYSRKLGITAELSRDLSIALGSSGMSLLELVNAYAIFANQGYRVEPVFIRRIHDRNGKLIYEADPLKEKVIDKTTAYIMTNLLEGVVKRGTGHRAKALKRPTAGKTGTTNNLFDAWFVGYTPQYITGTWVGFDDERSLGKGETGSRAASPIWLGFMKRIHEGLPIEVFPVPEGIVFSKIDAETGLLPIAESTETIFECFKEGTAPTKYTKAPDKISEPEEFYKTLM
ncbi:Multimodular transpeptidase-transglycosylase (EC (EC [Olavius algarvensis associated proteobacterium Delta 3]|nr:Multimodular transpeptidase-transglycosylase (EC (EC [Olavius algarvensis associated proteobacterium Delta 3]